MVKISKKFVVDKKYKNGKIKCFAVDAAELGIQLNENKGGRGMIVFCVIAAIGFLVLLLSLLTGELAEHGGDIVHEFGDHDVGHGVEHSHGGPSFFSMRIIAALVTGFGGAGAIARYYEFSYVLSSLIGIVSGFAMAFVVYSIVKFLYTQQATSGHALTELVGKTAKVSVGIPEGAAGEITLTYKGATVSQPARSEDGKAVKNGEIVTIKSVVGDTVVISKEVGR